MSWFCAVCGKNRNWMWMGSCSHCQINICGSCDMEKCPDCGKWLPFSIAKERYEDNSKRYFTEKHSVKKKYKEKFCISRAKDFERALNYEKAIEIYEHLEVWEEAGRCRRLQQQQKSPQTKVDIGNIDQSTKISDSVIHRSSIGVTSRRRISICPYCGEELNFPETPRYCPYCRKQILM